MIFSQLGFKDKLNAGLACKEWDHMVKDGTAAARHWDINYSVKRTVASTDPEKNYQTLTPGHPTANVGRSAQRAYKHTSQQGVEACCSGGIQGEQLLRVLADIQLS